MPGTNEEAIQFSYDIAPFVEAMEKMSKSFDSFANGMDKKEKQRNVENKKSLMQMTNNMKGFVNGAVTKMALLTNVFGLIFRGIGQMIKGVLSEIPEIGKTFSVAGDIIKRNLLYPLRIFLVPLLQKFLDWVKNSRGLFIKFGEVIVNVFKTLGTVIKAVWSLAKPFFQALERTIFGVTGSLSKNITDTINLALFKISILFMMFSAKLKPIADIVGKLGGQVIIAIKNMVAGIVSGFAMLDQSFNVLGTLKSVLSSITGLLERLNPILGPIMKFITVIVGGALLTALNAVKGILDVINGTIDLITGKATLEETFTKAKKETGGIFQRLRETGNYDIDSAMNAPNYKGKRKQNENDLAQTTPQEAIMQKSNNTDKSTKNNTNNVNAPVTINVTTTEGDAKKTGEEVGEGFLSKIRNSLLTEFVNTGGR